MTSTIKKRIIAALLFLSCLIGAWLLFLAPVNTSVQLQNFGQADSLLRLSFADFDIPKKRITTHTTQIDSAFSRKTYHISVPADFSKTQFHAALKARLSPYQISVPARVIFPDKDMHIYVEYRQTIIRTVTLATDEDPSTEHRVAGLIMTSYGKPPAGLTRFREGRLSTINPPKTTF